MPNNTAFYIFVPLSFMLLYQFKDKVKINIAPLLIVIISCLVLSFMINSGQNYILNKDYLRLISIVIFIITFAKLRGDKILKLYIWIAAIFVIITQFAFFLKLTSIANIIEKYYVINEYAETTFSRFETFQIEEFGINRLGGIYFNPNQCARYLELILITFLCEIKQFKKKELAILLPLIVFSIIATGSRTAFLVLFVIYFAYLYLKKELTKKNVFRIGLVSIIIIIIYLLSNYNISEYRMLKIDEGMGNSFGIKVGLLIEYLTVNNSIIALCFGNLSPEILTVKYKMLVPGTDFDIGDIFVIYGVVFFILFIGLCGVVYKRMANQYRCFFVILLWMFSSSIICNYRTAPIFFLMMGLYYRRSLIENSH